MIYTLNDNIKKVSTSKVKLGATCMKLCLSRYRFHIPKLERKDHINLHIRISCHHKKEKCHHTKSLWHNYMILLPYIFEK